MITKIFYIKLIYLLLFCDKLTAQYQNNIDYNATEEEEARKFIAELNKQYEIDSRRSKLVEWDYNSNITDENLKKLMAISEEIAKKEKESWKKVIQFNYERFSDESLKRQFQHYAVLGQAVLPTDKYNRLEEIIGEMESIYSTAKIRPRCLPYEKKEEPKKLSLDPELVEILAKSRNPKELEHVWLKWRDEIGPKCRDLFREYVELSKEEARLNNFTVFSEYWLRRYKDPDLLNKVNKIWQQLKPLYEQLHAYVRMKLREEYGRILVSEDGPIPAHLLGNMWGQSWSNLADLMLPYPEVKDADITDELRRQNYNAIRIFKTAEDFYKSINLTEMPNTFWANSILEKPQDGRETVCHASAWDFDDGKDFRIKQCTQITETHFFTAHHEMGHVEYFLQYKDQPFPFREGANDGFHEAIGDLIALSVRTPKHLKKLGLLPDQESNHKQILNNLFKLALNEVAFLPFSYLMDLWRLDVFSGKIKAEDYNCKWWEFKERYQGVEPPEARSESDFDPASKYHIMANVGYLRYFLSNILQYEFHKVLCEKSDQYDPNDQKKQLHECDIYGNTKAGNALKKMLAMGSSRPWPEALEIITGKRNLEATAILEYYKPLQKWLEQENKKNNAFIGWRPSKKMCTKK